MAYPLRFTGVTCDCSRRRNDHFDQFVLRHLVSFSVVGDARRDRQVFWLGHPCLDLIHFVDENSWDVQAHRITGPPQSNTRRLSGLDKCVHAARRYGVRAEDRT